MKKKIIILIVLLVLICSSAMLVFHCNNKRKHELYDNAINNYINVTKKYHNDRIEKYAKNVIVKVTLNDLLKKGYINEIGINPLTKQPFDSSMTFCIIRDNNEYSYLLDDGTNCGHTIINSYNTPEENYNGYLYTKKIEIDYSDLDGLEYYIKSVSSAKTNINIYESCGTDYKTNECHSIDSTKNIEPNIWYKVAGDIEVTYDEHNDNETVLYSVVTDNMLFYESNQVAIDRIDRKAPTIVLDTPQISTNSVSVKIKSIEDNEGNISSSVCSYGTKLDEYNITSMKNTHGALSKCSINYKLKDKIYYYQVCATDMVGNTGCTDGNSLIPSVDNPVINYVDDGASVLFGARSLHRSFYIKTTKTAILDSQTIEYCGKDTLPKNCIKSSTDTLIPNIWYKVEKDVVLKVSETSEEGLLYALIYVDDKLGASTTAMLR